MKYTKTGLLRADDIIFTERPVAVPYNYRISYRVSLLCLLIKECCGRKGCSLIKMNMIYKALSDTDFQESLNRFLEKDDMGLIVPFDPTVQRTLTYALADGLIIQQVNGLYQLSKSGKALADKLIKEDGILLKEKTVFRKIGYDLSEEKIKQLTLQWREWVNAHNQ